MEVEAFAGGVGCLDRRWPEHVREIQRAGRGVDGECSALAEPLNALDEQRSESILERSRWRFVAGDQGAEGRPAHQASDPAAAEHAEFDELGGEPRDRGSGEPAATSEFTNTERFVGGGDELKEEERALDRGRR